MPEKHKRYRWPLLDMLPCAYSTPYILHHPVAEVNNGVSALQQTAHCLLCQSIMLRNGFVMHMADS